jgi:hypothetical protein
MGITERNADRFDQICKCQQLWIGTCSFPANFYIYFICYSLHYLRDKGVLKRLRIQWWKKQLTELKSPWLTVDFYSITPILVVLTVGVIMAGILLLLETKWHQHQRAQPCELQN